MIQLEIISSACILGHLLSTCLWVLFIVGSYLLDRVSGKDTIKQLVEEADDYL